MLDDREERLYDCVFTLMCHVLADSGVDYKRYIANDLQSIIKRYDDLTVADTINAMSTIDDEVEKIKKINKKRASSKLRIIKGGKK